MSLWNALPWNTITLIIGLGLLIPSLLTILFLKFRRYEDAGTAIGIFLILLGTISFTYLIPYEVIDHAIIPEDYLWEDQGNVQYWERNSVFSNDKMGIFRVFDFNILKSKRAPIERNFTATEIIHAISYDKEKNVLLINDAIFDDSGEIFRVINNNEEVSEWYVINPSLDNLAFVNVDAGVMGIPARYTDSNSIEVGWVESNGEQNGDEHVVLKRNMQKIDQGHIQGIPVEIWQSDIYNTEITWHQETYLCDETLRFIVHPDTGYIINVYRHLVLSAKLSQFVQLYYPEYLEKNSVQRFLKIYNPIGEAAELIYETTSESQNKHLENIRGIQAQFTYIPLLICVPMFLLGIPLIWRYAGRSYYWKRYKKYDKKYLSEDQNYPNYNSSSRKKIFAIIFTTIIIGAAVFTTLLLLPNIGTTIQPDDHDIDLGDITFEEDLPTPPGTERTIDSGRHTLTQDDETMHKVTKREWWYFNVFFNDPDSDLPDWSMIISFNKMSPLDMRFVKRDNLFVILYDDQGTNYDFSTFDKRRGTFEMNSPGVNLQFENSWAKGTYPNWEVHAENKEKQFTVDLQYTADFTPIWVMGRSSNLGFLKFLAGDYYIPRCFVNGTMTWEGKEYRISGTGYHDHVWENNVPRFVTKGWEWFNLHFDNGWEMYLSKFILRTPKDHYAGAIILSPNTKDLVEFKFFEVSYLENSHPSGIPLMKYPKKYLVVAEHDEMRLELEIDIYNTAELVWPASRIGMFEGPCRVTGTLSWPGYTVDLNGYGMSEITRVRYLLQLPGILERKEPLIYKLLERWL